MGEVRVTVEVVSNADKVLVRAGFKKQEDVRRVKVDALVDTGAVNCVLPPFLADQLGLARPLSQMVEYADGRHEEVGVTEPVLLNILGRRVYEECLVLGDEMIIGQTALASTDLHVDCRAGQVLPNPAHPYQPIVKLK